MKNAASISIAGTAAALQDENGSDALRNFAVTAAGASFSVSNAEFRTSGDFSNAGTLQVDDGAFAIDGQLAQFDAVTGTLTGGSYHLVSGSLSFEGADIVTNAAHLRLYGDAKIIDSTGSDGLRNFRHNHSSGVLELSGHRFTATSNFTNE